MNSANELFTLNAILCKQVSHLLLEVGYFNVKAFVCRTIKWLNYLDVFVILTAVAPSVPSGISVQILKGE